MFFPQLFVDVIVVGAAAAAAAAAAVVFVVKAEVTTETIHQYCLCKINRCSNIYQSVLGKIIIVFF